MIELQVDIFFFQSLKEVTSSSSHSYKKSAVFLISGLLCILCVLPPNLLLKFLSLVFISLIVMCLGLIFFHISFVVRWTSEICKFRVLSKCRHFSAIISSNICSVPSPLQDPLTRMLDGLMSSHNTDVRFLFLPGFSPCFILDKFLMICLQRSWILFLWVLSCC